MIKKTLTLFCAIYSLTANSQTPISLNEIITQVKNNNKSINIAKLNTKVSQAELNQTRAYKLPQVSLNYIGMNTDNPLNVFGFKLQQEEVRQEDFNPVLLNNPSSRFNFNTNLTIKQPILNLDVKPMHDALNLKIASNEHQEKRLEQGILTEIKKRYNDLIFLYDMIQLSNAIKTQIDSNIQSVKNFYNQGLILKSELLKIEYEKQNLSSQIFKLEKNIESISNGLSMMMGLKANTIYQPTDPISTLIQPINEKSNINNREDFLAFESNIEAKKMMKKAEKNKILPRINGFAEYNINDPKLFGNAGSYLVGMQASWTFFDGNKSKYEIEKINEEIEKYHLELANEKDKALLEINTQMNEKEILKVNLEVALLNMQLTHEELRVLRNKKEQDVSKNMDVLLKEIELNQKKIKIKEIEHDLTNIELQLEFLSK